MMKKCLFWALMASLTAALAACGGKKKSDDIITQPVIKVTPKAPERMPEFSKSYDVDWIGRVYRVTVHRQPADSLPVVKDETGQKYVDNAIAVVVSRQDGSVFFKRTFTKADFLQYLDADYSNTGVLEGFVFSKADGDWLEFAASVSHPYTDEYIPLLVRLSRMGDLAFKRDSSLDTMSDMAASSDEEDDF